MANLKDIRSRIGTVKKTRQITSAMKLVAGAKLKRATDRALAARPYREQLEAVLRRVAAVAGDQIDEELLKPRDEVHRALVVVLTSDRGLCGPFNNGLLRQATRWYADKQSDGIELLTRAFGRKGEAYLRRTGVELEHLVTDYERIPKMELVKPLTSRLVSAFVDREVDEVYIVYNRFVSALTQTPTFERILPLAVDLDADDAGEPSEGPSEYRYEPSATEILGTLLPLYLETLVLGAFLETEAGEHAARMTAMDSATRNASDLIDQLTLDYNRARQAAITTEIIEIVSGAAAL